MDTNVTKFENRSLKGSTIHTKESRSAASAAELKLYASRCNDRPRAMLQNLLHVRRSAAASAIDL